MRAVIQRVSFARVTVGEEVAGEIGAGLLILLGIAKGDGMEDARWLAGKIARMRIFDDAEGVMNLDVTAVNGQCLVISQFTLFAATKRGNRPSWSAAAPPEEAEPMVGSFVSALEQELGRPVARGRFGADMQVTSCNQGPVTILMDSRQRD